MIDYNKLGTCIDNVFNYTTNSSRKVVSKLEGDCLYLTYKIITEISRENDIHYQTRDLEIESVTCINQRLKQIKDQYKDLADRNLRTKEIKLSSNPASFETLTVSPFSPKRTVKYSYTQCFEIS